ncbi:MAG: EpsG family protein [Chitinophagaceae bacterium]|nr:MAG: EpsG family protein [Chitinophagaceae bacterium]
MIYFIVFILLLFCTLDFGQNKNKVLDKIVYFLLFLILTLVVGLRFKVGGDSLAYQEYFSGYPNLAQLKHFDFKSAEYRPLWYILNAVIKSIDDSFTFFQLVQSFFVNGVIFWFIKKYCKFKYTAILFYFLLEYTYFNMEILRESFPICIFLLSIPFLIKRKWVIYYLFCIVAIYFHLSAIITLIIPFLYRKMKVWYIIALITVVWVPFILINPYEVFRLLQFTPDFANKVGTYTSLNINVYGVLMQIIAILPVTAIKLIRQKSKLPPHIFENIITAYIIIGIFTPVVGGFARFLNYLAIIAIIYIVDTIVLLKAYKKYFPKKYLLAYAFVLLLFSFQTYYYVRNTSRYMKGTRFYNLYLPYYSVFNPVTDHQREILYFKEMGMYY